MMHVQRVLHPVTYSNNLRLQWPYCNSKFRIRRVRSRRASIDIKRGGGGGGGKGGGKGVGGGLGLRIKDDKICFLVYSDGTAALCRAI